MRLKRNQNDLKSVQVKICGKKIKSELILDSHALDNQKY